MRRHPINISIREDEAAPSMGGAPAAPGNPDSKTNKHHFDSLERGLGMDDEGMTAALEGNSITVWQVPDYSSKWGYLVSGPVDASVEKRPDGNYSVTYQLKQKKLMEPKSFTLPYKKGERPMYYNGPVNDETVIVGEEELQDMMVVPFAKVGGAQPGAMGGPGGAPGGAPPGGAPPGGAPPGGAPPM